MYVILHMRSFNQVRDQVSLMEEIASLFILRNNVVLRNNYTDKDHDKRCLSSLRRGQNRKSGSYRTNSPPPAGQCIMALTIFIIIFEQANVRNNNIYFHSFCFLHPPP